MSYRIALLPVIVTLGFFSFADTFHAQDFASPQTCGIGSDGACGGTTCGNGNTPYASNRCCMCDAPTPPYCAPPAIDNCALRNPTWSFSSWDGWGCTYDYYEWPKRWWPEWRKGHHWSHQAIGHVQECRGINSDPRWAGGVMSYCAGCYAQCPQEGGYTAATCYSRPNSCLLRNAGREPCGWYEVRDWFGEWVEDERGLLLYGVSIGACNAPPVPESSCNQTPVGTFDGVTCAGGATGTALDGDTAAFGVPVRIYTTDPRPGGTYGAYVARVIAAPANAGTGGRFTWTIPELYRTGAAQTFYAFAEDINASGVPLGTNPIALNGTAQTLTAGCVTLPSGSASAYSCTSVAVAVSDPQAPPGGTVPIRVLNGLWGSGAVLASDTVISGSSKTVSFAGLTDGSIRNLYVYALDVPTGFQKLLGNSTAGCPLQAPSLTSVADGNYCLSGPAVPPILVSWTTAASPQTAYRIVAVAPGHSFDSGWQSSAATSAPIPQGGLRFGKNYNVSVLARGPSGMDSTPSNIRSLQTAGGQYPTVLVTMDPPKPAAGLPITFTDASTYYLGDSATVRSWDFDTDAIFDLVANPGNQSVQHIYPGEVDGIRTMLRVTSQNMLPGDYCETPTAVFDIQKPIPDYREVRPGTRPSPSPAQ